MNEVLKDLIRQKRQLEKTLVFLRKAIALRIADEIEKGAPEGMVIKKLSAFGENQGNCKYLAAVPSNFKGELKEAYFINGYYVDNYMEDYVHYVVPILKISVPEETLIFDNRDSSDTLAQWIPFKVYFKEFKIETD
jgi:hypothetical protein